ncbi:hypothetical protein Ahy_A01g000985 isoform C [Arachis hypogaea]|uniref:2-oxoacid dehydrogenase acyltransferase catalytic domain-containing protein n=1 Tax=Arachis hypogaea TaxID=3818 RepID=A0A445ELY0_ARAHY|nr:hypothetical protein Ahy_A01g000985 isoform C [Arachis hypogaea]
MLTRISQISQEALDLRSPGSPSSSLPGLLCSAALTSLTLTPSLLLPLLFILQLMFISMHCFSTQPALELPAGKIVDVPLAQTGEGIVECELLKWHVQEGIPKSNVKSMSLAAKVPHFHYVDEINCNALVELKTAFQRINPYPDVKHTFLPILVKSLSMALTKYPSLNSCFKEDSMEVIFKGSDNIEVAMATPNGLVVPNIKNVQSLSILQTLRVAKDLTGFVLQEAAFCYREYNAWGWG